MGVRKDPRVDESAVSLVGLGVSAEELHLLRSARPNVLLVGPPSSVKRLLDAIIPFCRPPIVESQGTRLTLPPPPIGTLVLQGADQLSAANQHRLHHWLLDADSSLQVISTASSPIFPLVQRKLFRDALYYRLNVMCLNVGPERTRR
jgi:hypothetical protein